MTVDGEEKKIRLTGLPAIAFQHELDHLNGITLKEKGVKIENNSTLSKKVKTGR